MQYNGATFHGWQSQIGLTTVQQQVERALSFVANHPVSVVCAGRTDAGVHATSQVIHFDSDADRKPVSWVFGANTHLPPTISLNWVKTVSSDFHARFSAIQRRYRYVLYNHQTRPAILRDGVGWYYRPLDVCRMQEAAVHLMGKHDFSSFRGSGCQAKSTVKTLSFIDVKRQGEMIIVEVAANAFLLHMVRNIVGVLVSIGSGMHPVDWIEDVLAAKDRREAGITIMPNGLYLIEVSYPASFSLPESQKGPFFLG